jgi:hypothetical protein
LIAFLGVFPKNAFLSGLKDAIPMISIRLEDRDRDPDLDPDPDPEHTLAMTHEFTHAVQMQADGREWVCPIGRPRITRLCH